jgi:hypothetical protein
MTRPGEGAFNSYSQQMLFFSVDPHAVFFLLLTSTLQCIDLNTVIERNILEAPDCIVQVEYVLVLHPF